MGENVKSAKENLLVSACLLGEKCKYSGGSNENPGVIGLGERYRLIPVCPEVDGGLPTPRKPAEIKEISGERRVVTNAGEDVTEEFCRGAAMTLETAKQYGCVWAVLKERSPSCGSGQIYDGTFSSTVVAGDGITAALLKKNGIAVFGESQIGELE